MSDPQQPPLPPYAAGATGATGAGQHPQPSYPTHASTQSSAPYQNGSVTARPQSPGINTPGRVGMIIGIVGLVVNVLTTVFIQMAVRSLGYQIVAVTAGVVGLLGFFAALAALILGLVGLKRIGAPHGQAGIAVGLGISGVTGGVVSYLISILAPMFY